MAQYRIPSDYQNDVSRSVHRWRSPVAGTIHPGLAYPVKWYHLDVGDRFRGKPGFLIQSQPMLGPLLQGFKLVTIGTFTPDSVLYGWLSSGIRYSTQELMGFDHYVFNPCHPFSGVANGKPSVFSTFIHPTSDTSVVNSVVLHVLGMGFGESGLNGLSIDSSTVLNSPKDDYLYHVGRGSLWEWLGVPAGATHPRVTAVSSGNPPSFLLSRSFDWRIEPLVSYFLSCYYYIANVQEENMYVSRGGYPDSGDASLTFSKTFVAFDPRTFLLHLDHLRHKSMSTYSGRVIFDEFVTSTSQTDDPLALMCFRGLFSHGGFLSVPYNPDLFNNIIKLGDAPTAYIPVLESSDGDKVAVPQMRIQTKIQSWMDRLFVSGGRLGDVFRTLWGRKSSPYTDRPSFLGIWQSSINPSNVVATANGTADGESANIGQMAARIDKYSDFSGHSGVDFTAKEPGTVMFISFLVPDVSYCQGLDPRLMGYSFADDFNPEMNGLGFVSVPRARYSLLPTSGAVYFNSLDPTQVAVGDSVAWDYYKTDYPRLHGELTPNGYFSYWALSRRFTEYVSVPGDPGSGSTLEGVYENFGTYINPLSWQYIFASRSVFDPNFILYANLDFTVTSTVKSTYMPYMSK